MPLPRTIDYGALDSALRGLGFDGQPAIRSLTYVFPAEDDTHAVEVVTAQGVTVRIPLTARVLSAGTR